MHQAVKRDLWQGRHFDQLRAPYKVAEAIAETVKRCISEANISAANVLGVGLGMAGLVDAPHGISLYSPMLHWQNVELGPALAFQRRMPVRIDNDVNTLAVAERRFGVGKTCSDFILITVGLGVGVGIVINGDIYHGAHGGAGEFGHITVDVAADAPLCNCGKRGCLEAIVSDYALIRAAKKDYSAKYVRNNSSRIVAELAAQARAGDKELQDIFTYAGSMLGIAIANLINCFDPACVFLEEVPAGELLLEPMRAIIPKHIFGPAPRSTIHIIPPANEAAWARGAASLVLSEVFQSPIYSNQGTIVIDDLLTRSSSIRKRKG